MSEIMRDVYVPLAVPAILGGVGDVANCCVNVGQRCEVNLAAVADNLGVEAASALGAYYLAATRFWVRWQRGDKVAGMLVRRRIEEWRQETGKGKSDLGDQYQALLAMGGQTANTLVTLLQAKPDGRELSVFELTAKDYPTALGGVAGPGELRRRITVEARYAPWRDRRVRRLGAVVVDVDELWPEPDEAVVAAWATRPPQLG